MRNSLRILLITLITVVYFGSVAGAALEDGLVAYWTFDEGSGTTAADATGNGWDLRKGGSHSGWSTTADAKIGNSAYQNKTGKNGAFVHDDPEDFINGLNAFSLALWIKSDEDNTGKGFINGVVPNIAEGYFSFRYSKTGSAGEKKIIRAGIATEGGTNSGIHIIDSSGNVQTTDWQHLVLTWRSGEAMKLYINGTLNTLSATGPIHRGTLARNAKFFIGRGPLDTNPGNEAWHGLIDDVRLYNRPLTQAEITTLASAANGVALAGVGNLTHELPIDSGDVVYTIRITNTSSTLNTISLTTKGDVNATLSRNEVSLAPGQSTDVILTISEDVLADLGEYEVSVTATFQGDPTKTVTITTNTIIFTCGVALAGVGDLETETANASAGISYTIRVTNIGNLADTITLTTSGDVDATLNKTSVSLAGGASEDVTLTIPAEALTTPGEYEVKVKATSGKHNTETDEITTKTTIIQGYGVALVGVGDLETETADASAGVSYTIRITNTGNSTDTITLTTSGDVDATLNKTSVSLAGGASEDVTLTIPAEALTTPGEYEVKVKATSGKHNTETDEITTKTTIIQGYGVALAGVGDLETETADASGGCQLYNPSDKHR